MAKKKLFSRLELVHEGGSPEETVQNVGELLIPLEEYLSKKTKTSSIEEREFPLTPEETSDFFEHITNDSRNNAKKILSRCKEVDTDSPWITGYITALRGMVYALRKNASVTPLIFELREKDGEELKTIRKEFTERIERTFTPEFDRGFLTAWIQYISVLLLYK